MKKLLIFSNNAASSSESNGRIHMTQFLCYGDILNFYLRGNPDLKNVKYINFRYLDALKMKFGVKKKPSTENQPSTKTNVIGKKGKKPFFHFLRNKVFSNNKLIINYLHEIIINECVEALIVWGTDVPFLYEYAYKLSELCSIPLVIITGENYPLKKYNYISNKPSLFFSFFQSSLRKWAKKAHQHCSANIYLNSDLKSLYEDEYNIANGYVVFFGSQLSPSTRKISKINNIFYGGNLYDDRVESIIKISQHLDSQEGVIINVYGCGDDNSIGRLKKCKNVIYHGTVAYDNLVDFMYSSDLLIFVEGFSSSYINDCRYAFSTKIADYISTNIPFFCFGPKEISGIKYLYKTNPDITAISEEELYKLVEIINGKNVEIKGRELFDSKTVSRQVANIIEGIQINEICH